MIQYVGLSLSFCVRDLLAKRVQPQQVAYIIPNFPYWTGTPVASYYNTYWNAWDRDEVNSLLKSLTFVQRKNNLSANIANGYWIEASDFSWEAYQDASQRTHGEPEALGR